MTQAALEAHAQSMYDRTNAVWKQRKHEIFDGRCGFSILSGPPIYRPSLMIVGANFGFNAEDEHGQAHVETTWPDRSYVNDPGLADWHLARRIRDLFSTDRLRSILDHTIQTNFNFFKSASDSRLAARGTATRWEDLPVSLQSDLRDFCRNELKTYVRLARPRQLLILGLQTFDRNCEAEATVELKRANGRGRLLVKGSFEGAICVGIPHPTGSRISGEDWARLRNWLELALA